MRYRYSARTDVGRVREHNEDSHLVDADLGLVVVADGMGGRAAGEVASRMAVQAVREHVEGGRALVEACAAANLGSRTDERADAVAKLLGESVVLAAQAVFGASLAESGQRGMGTTLTTLVLAGDRAFIAHVGDSRAYLVRQGQATQLTRDHSLVDELVLAGQLTREEARSPELERLRCVLARAVGVANEVAVDVQHFEVLPGDHFMLCSDGLTHYLDDVEIAAQLLGNLDASVEKFVSLACERGGHDNITAAAVRCESSDKTDLERLRDFDRRAAALSRVPVLQGLDPREFLHVILAAETVVAEPGTTVLREDSAIPALFVVHEGKVRLSREGRVIGDAGPGAWFGDAALVDRWISAPTAVAADRTRLVRITRESLVAVSRREPEIAPKIVATFARLATRPKS